MNRDGGLRRALRDVYAADPSRLPAEAAAGAHSLAIGAMLDDET